MKKFLAFAAAATLLPMAASAAEGRLMTCTVADIANATGVCAQVEMPVPPRDVLVRVVPAGSAAAANAGATNASLGGLGGATPAVIVVIGAGVIAGLSGGSSNGTN